MMFPEVVMGTTKRGQMGQWPDLAAASAEVVDDFCSWKIDHFPSRRLDPFAPVNVFPVEEAFIQQTDLSKVSRRTSIAAPETSSTIHFSSSRRGVTSSIFNLGIGSCKSFRQVLNIFAELAVLEHLLRHSPMGNTHGRCADPTKADSQSPISTLYPYLRLLDDIRI